MLSVGETDLLDEFKGRFEVVSRPWLKDDEKLAELYQASDVFLMPSVQEAFGMMAIEAMSCGKPVLAIEGTALPAVIHSPDCGLAVPAEHYPEMLQYWTDHPDEVEKRSMVSYEYARANYGKDLYISRVLAVYQEAVRDFRPLKNAEYIWSQIRKYPPQVKPEEAALQQAWLELERLQARHESLLNTKTMRLLNGIRRCFGMNELK